MTDNIDNLMRDLALKDSDWHRHENPQTGAVVIFPDVPRFPSGSKEARAAEDDWEQRCLAMHAEQETITLEPKPSENTMTRIKRGD